jgi:hypothetical protein
VPEPDFTRVHHVKGLPEDVGIICRNRTLDLGEVIAGSNSDLDKIVRYLCQSVKHVREQFVDEVEETIGNFDDMEQRAKLALAILFPVL